MTFWVDLAIVVYFLAMNFTYLIMLFLSAIALFRSRAIRVPELDHLTLRDESTPPIAIIAPAFNEQETIVDSIRALLQLDYPHYEVIVVNDGSTDATMQLLMDRFELVKVDLVWRPEIDTRPVRSVSRSKVEPRLLVVDKDNGGKADALNVGVNLARTPLVCCVDADSLLTRKALLRLVEPFTTSLNVVVTGGTVRLANGATVRDGLIDEIKVPSGWLARFQVVEYIRSFLFARLGLNVVGGNLIVSGAMGLFERRALVEIGGYASDTVGEDMEVIVRMHHYMRARSRPYEIVFIPDPVCYTEAPETLSILHKQRDRWQRGLMDSLWRHKAMFMNPRYGLPGVFTFPTYVFFEALGPLVELFGYIWFVGALLMGRVDFVAALLFFAVAFALGMLLSLQALILDDLAFRNYQSVRDRLKLIGAAALENFGYRQVTLFARVVGIVRYFLGSRAWGKMRRQGFKQSKTAEAAA